METRRKHLLQIYTAAIDAVAGDVVVKNHLQQQQDLQDSYVIAIGKVADAMMQGALAVLQDKLISGLLISKQENFSDEMLAHPDIQCVEGDHPVPSEKSLSAGQQLVEYIEKIPQQAHCLLLISGGASSLVEVLAEHVSLNDLQASTDYLLANGYDIHAINTVRKYLSQIKGGGLWRYLGQRRVQCLMISDVQGDDPAVIGSGLLFPKQYEVLPDNLPDFIVELVEPSKPIEPSADFTWSIVACLDDAKLAAQQKAKALGYSVTVVNEYMQGDAVKMAQRAVCALEKSTTDIMIWGGETTVCLPENAGSGGRNQHLALAAAIEISGRNNFCLLSMASDGVDGNTIDAGAVVDGRTVQRGELYGVSASYCLQRANANLFLEESGDLVFTGPSRTNVTDLLIGLKLS